MPKRFRPTFDEPIHAIPPREQPRYRRIKVKWPAYCKACYLYVEQGTEGVWDLEGRNLYCNACGTMLEEMEG